MSSNSGVRCNLAEARPAPSPAGAMGPEKIIGPPHRRTRERWPSVGNTMAPPTTPKAFDSEVATTTRSDSPR